ncbi:MAG TPA: polyamine ABC transporter substrate-binding protein [Stellaceae bacterium]|nr:polyamine ABC transporter substrate-binding protein [Stellaceae bacterium]
MKIGSIAARILALLLLALPLPAGAAGSLHIYNWSDYIAPDTIPKFEKETGIKVTYDVYDSNEVLEAKLLAGGSGYDLVFPSATPFLARQVAAHIYRPLDKAKLPNWKNLDPEFLARVAPADPGNAHGVPYLWSVTGIGYNRAMVEKALGKAAPVDSWALIFDPANAKKLAACGISLLDTPYEVFPAMLAYLHRDPKSTDPGDLKAALAALEKIRPTIRKFHSSEYINGLAGGDLCVALGYSGDVIQARNRAREARNGVDIAFSIPKEGAQMAVDMMAIPQDAPHPDAALQFINYILRPRVIADITDAVSYPNPNLAALPFVAPAIRNDPEIYPPPAVERRFYVLMPAPMAYERARTRAWTRLKTGG